MAANGKINAELSDCAALMESNCFNLQIAIWRAGKRGGPRPREGGGSEKKGERARRREESYENLVEDCRPGGWREGGMEGRRELEKSSPRLSEKFPRAAA